MRPVYFTETLRVNIDFPGATKFRLTTAFKQKEFDLSKCRKHMYWELANESIYDADVVDLETLKWTKPSDAIVFYVVVADTGEYYFKALVDRSWQTIEIVPHYSQRIVTTRVTRVK